jgi:hypothetical protein
MTIKTTYVGPIGFRGAKIKASFNTKQVTIDYDYSLNSEARHYKAAKAFADKHGLTITDHATNSHNKGFMFTVTAYQGA